MSSTDEFFYTINVIRKSSKETTKYNPTTHKMEAVEGTSGTIQGFLQTASKNDVERMALTESGKRVGYKAKVYSEDLLSLGDTIIHTIGAATVRFEVVDMDVYQDWEGSDMNHYVYFIQGGM